MCQGQWSRRIKYKYTAAKTPATFTLCGQLALTVFLIKTCLGINVKLKMSSK